MPPTPDVSLHCGQVTFRTITGHHASCEDNRPGPLVLSSVSMAASITVVIFCWHICLISESMGHHDSEIMDDGSID
jgi:hypothetical protein